MAASETMLDKVDGGIAAAEVALVDTDGDAGVSEVSRRSGTWSSPGQGLVRIGGTSKRNDGLVRGAAAGRVPEAP